MPSPSADTDLPSRAGPRPSTTRSNPQYQLEQVPDVPLSDRLIERVARLDGVELGASRRSPPGTVGFFLAGSDGLPEASFLLGNEFAHVHITHEHGLHLVLPEPVRTAAMRAGWAEPHPLAGRPTVSPLTVLVYAPRDAAELEVTARLVEAAWALARGDRVAEQNAL